MPMPLPALAKRVIRLKTVGSTMDVARSLAELGWPEGTVVVAEEQTVGRGRLGRPWASPRGGLWFSLLLRPSLKGELLSLLPIAVALAVARALKALFGIKAGLKWPNDVLIRGKKVCGVLVESSSCGHEVSYAIVGVGINANFGLEELPEDLRGSATTLREELGRDVDLEELLMAVLRELQELYRALKEGSSEGVLREAERLMGFPRGLRVLVGRDVLSGTAIGLADDGSLLLRLPDGRVERVHWASATVLADQA